MNSFQVLILLLTSQSEFVSGERSFRMVNSTLTQVYEIGAVGELSCSSSSGWELCSWRRTGDKNWCHLLHSSSESVYCVADPRVQFQKSDGFVCRIKIYGIQEQDAGSWICSLKEEAQGLQFPLQTIINIDVISPFNVKLHSEQVSGDIFLVCQAHGEGTITPEIIWFVNSIQVDSEYPNTFLPAENTIIESKLNQTQFLPGDIVRCLLRQTNPWTGKVVFESAETAVIKDLRVNTFSYVEALETSAGFIVLGLVLFLALLILVVLLVRNSLNSGTSGSYKIQEEKVVFSPSGLKPEDKITEESNLLAITTQGEDKYVRLVKLDTQSPLLLYKGLKNSELLKNGENRDLNAQSGTQTKNGSLAPTRSTSSPNFARINRFPVPININGSSVSKRSNDSPIPFIGDNSPRSNLSVASSLISQSYAYPIPIRETDSPESLRYIPQGPSRVGGLNSNYLHSIHPSEFPLPYYPPSPEFQNFHPGFVPGTYSPVYLYPTHGALTSSPIHPLNTLQQYPREAEPSPQYSTPLRPQDITEGLNENPDFSKLGENYKNPSLREKDDLIKTEPRTQIGDQLDSLKSSVLNKPFDTTGEFSIYPNSNLGAGVQLQTEPEPENKTGINSLIETHL
ncbi:uncharacterized protein LOC111708515 isoform X2 [Eurytemora carolleeae]|uniref:uncharacterized protein LOC111708515 isoform X2 n=1 Tax=Eurytemora carolleeae TaxID=1294199 RepID=UPI000C783A84|nr:uncharacterized protein LOC111708515 isoform X2 [Eurytemora carolleeae]|eukprot:XP_023337686.1 uncharacterized protein LOC111708515 isoform X2 [Eurytemora affinis]